MEGYMKRFLIASAALLLLGACDQQQPSRTQAVAAPLQRNFTVYFDTDKSALTAESQSTVAQAANAFKAGGGRAVAVSGHTDTTGTPDYNLQLSRARAASVGDALRRNGVPGDANDLGRIADRSFDAVVLNAVLHWLPEKTGPLLSFWRVLRYGGRLGISTALKGDVPELVRTARAVLAEPPFDAHPRPREGITFRVEAEELRALLQTTGFQARFVEVREHQFRHTGPEDALRFMEASSFGNVLGHLPAELRELARTRVRERFAALAGPDGIVSSGRRVVAIAERR
jgi:SAM-dependent methyltransferase